MDTGRPDEARPLLEGGVAGARQTRYARFALPVVAP
jgi:hypothetical protein